MFERHQGYSSEEAIDLGFDAAIEFQPMSFSSKKAFESYLKPPLFKKIIRKFYKEYYKIIDKQYIPWDNIIDYKKFVEFDLSQEAPKHKCFPGVSPMWDNSSRRVNVNARIFKNSTPEAFGHWYRSKLEKFVPYSKEENFIFINAWNEWAEGNHLEPCEKWGFQYLEELIKI